MGFFDRFAAKKQTNPTPNGPAAVQPTQAAPTPSPAPSAPDEAATPATPVTAAAASAAAGNVKAQLLAARERLEAKDLPGAMAVYEELLRVAGDRPDVLVTLSGDLGSCGYVEQIVELVAPRYDAEKHGPATGLNLLQAYLATRNTTAAQHLLDILFSLQRPELEERLYGFSNALAELLEAERRGQLPPPSPTGGVPPSDAPQPNVVALVTISKPIWAYGVEQVPGILPASRPDRARRIAFGQLSLLGIPDLMERAKKPEDELGRFCRGFPLWMAEMFSFSPHYAPVAAIGTLNKERYFLFGAEWTANNIRELVNTSEGLDYVFTGSLQHSAGDFELKLKVWEIKRFRERKMFVARWSPATAAAELAKLAETVRMFMEWAPFPAGTALALAQPAAPQDWCDSLGSSLSFFLADKGVLTRDQLEPASEVLARVGARAASSEAASLAYLTLLDRAIRMELVPTAPAEAPLFSSPAVEQARGFLNL